jgi:hypothetical protein
MEPHELCWPYVVELAVKMESYDLCCYILELVCEDGVLCMTYAEYVVELAGEDGALRPMLARR